jgi:hypothetical protein
MFAGGNDSQDPVGGNDSQDPVGGNDGGNGGKPIDTDKDGIDNSVDTDDDNDGVDDVNDAFPLDSNETTDTDGDGTGDNTDLDDDNDRVVDTNDAFPLDPTETIDTDGDGTGDNADLDDDNDGVDDVNDAFPLDPTETTDTDGDGTGDNTDLDDDNDGVDDVNDAFPLDPTETTDTDGDGTGDNTDLDDDNDGVDDANDVFPLDPTETIDTDGDGTGDNTDLDDDNDGVDDANDAFPLDPTETLDSDGDGVGDNLDSDSDNDGVDDANDAFPLDPTETIDTDGDKTGDNADLDDDNDGVDDVNDAFPLDHTETTDTDGDGIGDNADPDTDGDGFIDKVLRTLNSNPYEGLIPFKIRTNIESNSRDNVAKPLLRTNPKVSTNIKLIVDGSKMYLESFNATDQLAASNYKKHLVKETGSYAYDVAKFWNKNSTPNELIYKVKREYSDFSVLDSYDKQFEETYNYGTTINYNKLYDNQFNMLAPIWLDRNLPTKFVIYRVKDPINTESYSNSENLNRINEMLKNSTLIKTFDLSENSSVGKYIRNYVNDSSFPDSPLTVSFNKDEQTFYNGIDLEKGGFTSKGEFQYKDIVKTDKPIIEYNSLITDGFARNNIACANLINLEFLFDDDEASEFSINRYFGIYVDEHPLGSGIVESIKKDVFKLNIDTVSSELDTEGEGLIENYKIPYYRFYKDMPMIGWVKSFSNYHNIKNGVYWNIKNNEIKVDTNNEDSASFLGIKKTDNNITAFENLEGDGDYIKLKIISNPISGDSFKLLNLKKQKFSIEVIDNQPGTITIQDNLGNNYTRNAGPTIYDTLLELLSNWPTTGTNTFKKYEPTLIKVRNVWKIELIEKEYNFEENHSFTSLNNNSILNIKTTYTPISVVKNTFLASNQISKGRFEDNYFSNQGTLNNVANSISNLINNNNLFNSIVFENEILISSKLKGYNKYLSVFIKELSSSNFIEINNDASTQNISSNFLLGHEIFYLTGGSNPNFSIYINEDDFDNIDIGDYLLDSTNNFNKILDIVDDSRELDSEFKRIILKNKNTGLEGVLNVYRDFKIEWGMFSAYDIHDMDFDFYDEDNSNLKELELEDEIIYPFSKASSEPIGPGGEPPLDAYSDVTKLTEISATYFSNLINILEDENSLPEGSTMTKIYSEFERLQENNTTDFATISRIVPYINKWALKNTVNVRENPYYLNVNESFGETNFSPNLESEDRDETKMTHEWFYIDEYPTYVTYSDVDNVFSYIKPSPNIEFNLDHFKDVNFDYFKTYFTGTGAMVGSQNTAAKTSFGKSRTFKKYTIIEDGNTSAFASTIFKGLRFIPKTRKKIENSITKEFVKNSQFNGYKFSTVLKTTFNTGISNKLNVKVIENKRFKFIVLILDLNLSDDNFSFLNRKLLYELDHKLEDIYNYSDSKISGALDLSSVNLSSGQSTIINGVNHSDGSSPAFTSQILKDPVTSAYGILELNIGGITYELRVNNVINDFKISVTGEMTVNGVPQPTQFYTLNQYKGAEYTYKGGGIFAHDETLKLLSANNIVNLLNKTNSAEYLTINEDGSSIENTFSLEVQDGVEIVKTSNLYPEVDFNKPKAFGLTNESIGYNIESRNEYFAFLTRHNGKYTINTNPIVTFSEPFSMHKIEPDEGYTWADAYNTPVGTVYNYDLTNSNENKLAIALYRKLNGLGVLFNVGEVKSINHDLQWGVIKNMFFHKVNDIDTNGVIKLSESDDLLPKYNLINEIAIDKKDKNMFMSRWEDNYYIRSTSGGGIQYIPGTKNIVEEKSFMSSSAIKLSKTYDIYNFTVNKYENLEILNEIKLLGTSKHDINYTENDKEVIIDFYMRESVVKELGNLGLNYTMNRLVNVEDSFGRIDTLEDDISGYIVENIIPIFSIGTIRLGVYESKKITTEIETISILSDLTSNDYVIDNNFTYKLDPVNPLNFRLIYNKRIGYSYKIRPLIKIKS